MACKQLWRSVKSEAERGTAMSTSFGSGLHVAPGRAVDTLAYDRYLGRWSRLFVPALIAAAEVSAGYRVLHVATGPGEAALMTLPVVGPSDVVIGADISPAMLEAARPPWRPDVFARGSRRPGIAL